MSSISKRGSDSLAKPPTRSELVAMVGRVAPLAIANLAAAVENGDVRASEIVLKKVLPDLKAVDSSDSGNTFSVVIAPRIYAGKTATGGESVSLGDITINIGRSKEESGTVVDVTPSEPGVTVVEPEIDYKARRRKGRVFE